MKRDLVFARPRMNAAGMLGFTPDLRDLSELGILPSFGAFVTNPVSLRPRRPTQTPALIEYAGGLLLHTGLPNPGLTEVLKKHAAHWARAVLPIVVHLMADRPEETQRMVRRLESAENVMAAELGFAPLLAPDILLLTLEMCGGELPLIFSLPAELVLSLGPRLMEQGASAIGLAPPRGSLPRGELVAGRLYGPGLFPQTLEIVRAAAKLGLPIIGAGGVWAKENEEALLSAGAIAVQLDASLWLPRGAASVLDQN